MRVYLVSTLRNWLHGVRSSSQVYIVLPSDVESVQAEQGQ